jgi:hypothetical protein
MLGTITFLPNNSVLDIENVTGVSVTAVSSSEILKYNQISAFKVPTPLNETDPEISFTEGSKMPIVDLSKGYSSKLPIVEIPKNFNSRMPITELKAPNPILFHGK